MVVYHCLNIKAYPGNLLQAFSWSSHLIFTTFICKDCDFFSKWLRRLQFRLLVPVQRCRIDSWKWSADSPARDWFVRQPRPRLEEPRGERQLGGGAEASGRSHRRRAQRSLPSRIDAASLLVSLHFCHLSSRHSLSPPARDGCADWVRDVAWAPNTAVPFNIVASCSEDRSVIIWKQLVAGWYPSPLFYVTLCDCCTH